MDTKKLLETISEDCLSQLTKYKYNKGLDISDKYRKGKITALQYILDLTYHFFEKDKELKKDFESMIKEQRKDMNILEDGDYKKGLMDVLNWTNKRINQK